MKIVVCKNCGAKYQLDDADDINAFECSVCSGDLEELESFSNSEEQVSSDYNSQDSSDHFLVYCTNCGLKYQLSENDNINEFECNSCGGSLDYVYNMDSTSQDSASIFIDNPLTENPLISTEIDEIIPIHADPYFTDSDVDEIIPIHAEANFTDSDVDEIIPIHAEANAQDETYYDDEYSYDDEYLVAEAYESDDDMIPYGSIYDSSLGDTDEIIPIHAEKRYMETSRDLDTGFAYNAGEVYEEELEDEEQRLVEITDIPEDELPESPVSLTRQELSEEDQKLFARVQNEMVFDSPEEYEAFKLASYKYYTALTDSLKDDFIRDLDKEYYKNSSVKRLIKRGEESVKRSNIKASEEDALINQETVELMKSQNRAYEPKKTYADVYILIGAFVLVVSAAY